jgi:tRNA nucleotidyltransferase (CCA-adding enzyme)
MRAIQFASRFQFIIEVDTWEAILDNAPSINEISGERILIELDKIFDKGDKAGGINLFMASTLHCRLFSKIPHFTLKSVFKTRADFFLAMQVTSAEFTMILKGDVKTGKLMGAISTLASDTMDAMGSSDNFSLDIDIRIAIAKAFKKSDEILTSSTINTLIGSFTKPFRDGELPITIKELDITGLDLMELGFKGQALGVELASIFDAVLRQAVKNNKEDIIKFIKVNS